MSFEPQNETRTGHPIASDVIHAVDLLYAETANLVVIALNRLAYSTARLSPDTEIGYLDIPVVRLLDDQTVDLYQKLGASVLVISKCSHDHAQTYE